MMVRAEGVPDNIVEDIIEGEEDEEEGDATVETDDVLDGVPSEAAAVDDEKEEEEEEKPLKASPDADTYLLFTKPTSPGELPAGQVVRLLVGFTNKGDKDFVVENMEASFRYPQDYTYIIQNFTTVQFNRVVEPKRQATLEYAFTPSEAFNARPFGLAIMLNYKDAEGQIFQDAVYNETITITEPDEGLDGETFFLYIFLAAIVFLLIVGAQQLLATFGKKRLSKPKPVVEMGTQSKGDVDFDWIPKTTLDAINKSPGRSPKSKTSPHRRRANRTSGADD